MSSLGVRRVSEAQMADGQSGIECRDLGRSFGGPLLVLLDAVVETGLGGRSQEDWRAVRIGLAVDNRVTAQCLPRGWGGAGRVVGAGCVGGAWGYDAGEPGEWG